MGESVSIILNSPWVHVVDGTIGMVPFTVTSLTASSGDWFYFCVKSLTWFLMGRHRSRCLDRVLQTSAVSHHLPSSHPLVPNCIRVSKKENDLNGIYLAQRDGGLAGKGRGIMLSIIPKGSVGKARMKPVTLSFHRSQVRQKQLHFSFSTFQCVIILLFIFFIICPQVIVSNDVPRLCNIWECNYYCWPILVSIFLSKSLGFLIHKCLSPPKHPCSLPTSHLLCLLGTNAI